MDEPVDGRAVRRDVLLAFEYSHLHEAWVNPLTDALSGVSAPEAIWQPDPEVKSIWQIVLHMTGWAEEVRLRVAGAPAGTPVCGDWPRVGPVGRARWDAARAALFIAYRALQNDVARMRSGDLSLPTSDPRTRETGIGMSRYVTIHGVIHHAAYHAGQIALLKRALRG